MKTRFALVVVAVVLLATTAAWAQMGGGFAPGHGMMGHTAWPRPWQGNGWHSMGFSIQGLLRTKDQAAQVVRAHMQALGNRILRLGELAESDAYVEAAILTMDGSFVEKVVVDKRTGWLRSGY